MKQRKSENAWSEKTLKCECECIKKKSGEKVTYVTYQTYVEYKREKKRRNQKFKYKQSVQCKCEWWLD